jgi:tRNA(adenine34) deaminase
LPTQQLLDDPLGSGDPQLLPDQNHRPAELASRASIEHTRLESWMDRLLRHAAAVGETGEIPVAAAMLDAQGRCIGWGSNRRHREMDPLGHAELVALRQAALLLGDWRFNACTLVVTLEPCPMCAGALVQARVGRVVYGAPDPKRGALGGCLDLASDPSAHHAMTVVGGVRGEQAGAQLTAWFRQRRSGRQAARPRTDPAADRRSRRDC